MASLWVVNASPFITLAKSGHLDLFSTLPGKVILPAAVVREILDGPTSDPARIAGESAVIATAMARRGIAVVDDAKGRMCARTMRVPLIGTLGIVLRARRARKIKSAALVIRDLLAADLFLHDDLIGRILRKVGEKWEPRIVP